MADKIRHLTPSGLGRLLAVVCVALLARDACAASAGNAYPALGFTVFSMRAIAGDVAFVPHEGGAPQKLAFQSTARSAHYEYRGPMPLRFIDAKSGATIAEASIPPNIHEALLLFTPLATDAAANSTKAGAPALRYQIAVLDDSAARLAPGGLAILNLSGLTLTGVVNKDRVALKPGLNAPLNVGRSAEISLTTLVKNRTHRAFATTVTLRGNDRALLILMPPYYAGGFEVQSRLLVDQPPGSAPPAANPGSRSPAKR